MCFRCCTQTRIDVARQAVNTWRPCAPVSVPERDLERAMEFVAPEGLSERMSAVAYDVQHQALINISGIEVDPEVKPPDNQHITPQQVHGPAESGSGSGGQGKAAL